jgi:hypothetical protein
MSSVVLCRRESHAVEAVDVAALAHDCERLVVAVLGSHALLDALVHLAKERFVHRQPFLSLRHAVSLVAGE